MAHEYDNLEAAARAALGEVLNLAAQVAEMQLNEEARSDIYELLDTVADHYGVERTEVIIDEEDGTAVVKYNLDYDDDDSEPAEVAEREESFPSYISLAVDNDKKLH